MVSTRICVRIKTAYVIEEVTSIVDSFFVRRTSLSESVFHQSFLPFESETEGFML